MKLLTARDINTEVRYAESMGKYLYACNVLPSVGHSSGIRIMRAKTRKGVVSVLSIIGVWYDTMTTTYFYAQ